MNTSASIDKAIYRPTSVYGYLRKQHRIGLISAFILKGIRQQVVNITGQMDTLRDFIWVEDIANFLANALLTDVAEPIPTPYVLGSGKPSSISEIKRYVELALERKIYVNYSLDLTNSEDIIFSPKVFPLDLHPSDLQATIRHICDDAMSTGAAFA